MVGKSDGFQQSNWRGVTDGQSLWPNATLAVCRLDTEWWRTVSVRVVSSEIIWNLCQSVLILTCFAYSRREIACQICISWVQPTREPWLLEITGVTNDPQQKRGIGVEMGSGCAGCAVKWRTMFELPAVVKYSIIAVIWCTEAGTFSS